RVRSMRAMRRRLPIAALAVVSLVLSACGATDDATPVACLDGPGAYVGALGNAPGEVELSGEVPISDCLAENQQGGDLATVGKSMVEAATRLNGEAREERGNEAALQLGYLLGAAARGADETGGIHTDLLRRLDTAARFGPAGGRQPSASFQRAYEAGFEAGRERG
ncbi:MAG TPA: hypothetical protein VEQ41_09220, partial [Solirubrobacterales bacterium]|nr:hypothetical protein [Solirubrobacterales bacterium]